jgi:uncharacterized protein (UPF0264 family)
MSPSLMPIPGLLVSVRSDEEAMTALEGGASIIDVKEPDHGSLGKAADAVIHRVIEKVAGRRPVSAALGELRQETPALCDSRLCFVKWGLADCRFEPEFWQSRLNRQLARSENPQTVVVAYADWQCAQAPAITEVVAFACRHPGRVLLIDTHGKTPAKRTNLRPTLLDWLSAQEVKAICAACHDAGVRVALAGSLDMPEITQLLAAGSDWFAVRGAVCEYNDRRATINLDKVRHLANFLSNVSRTWKC